LLPEENSVTFQLSFIREHWFFTPIFFVLLQDVSGDQALKIFVAQKLTQMSLKSIIETCLAMNCIG